jgi:hypothetical protein
MIFNSTESLIPYSGFKSGTNFAELNVIIDNIEEEYLIPYLGIAQYNQLLSIVNSNSNSNIKLKFIDKCKSIVGAFVTHKYASKSEINLSSAGLKIIDGDGSKGPYQYQRNDYLKFFYKEGFTFIDKLLSFLFENKTEFPLWANSDACEKCSKLFIRSGSEYRQSIITAEPSIIYWNIVFKLQEIEDFNLYPVFGEDFITDLKVKHNNKTLSNKEKHLVYLLQKYTAYAATAAAIPFLQISLDSNGLTIAGSQTTGNDNSSSKKDAGFNIDKYASSCSNSASQFSKLAKDFIINNTIVFPTSNLAQPSVVEDKKQFKGTYFLG